LQPLTRVGALDRSAQDYAVRMAREGFFSHTAPDGSDPGDRIQAVSYPARTWGENIAAGQQTAESVMFAWMNSPGHAANILNANFTHIGIGVAAGGPYRIYWVQNFGATFGSPPAGVAPHLGRLTSSTVAAGATVTLEGTNLGSPGEVTFGGVPAVIDQWTSSSVVVRAPSANGTVVLTNAQGSSNGLPFGATVNPPPAPPPPPTGATPPFTLRGLTPRFGVTGATVRLSGSGFGATPGRVTVAGVNATIVSWSDTLIVVRITGTTRGRHDVRVVRADGQTSNLREFRQTR
jgi:hypothetical protein